MQFLPGPPLETCGVVLGDVEGGRPSAQPLRIHRASERFETLRRRAEKILYQKAARPKVFLASVGSPAKLKPRIDFSKEFFEVGGFEVLGSNDAFENAEGAAQAALASGALHHGCLLHGCSISGVDSTAGRRSQKAAPEMTVLVAGKPGPEHEQAYRDAGVDDFFFAGVNCYKLLSELQERIDP